MLDGGEITTLLRAWQAGDSQAMTELMTRVYPCLHSIAAAQMSRERAGHTLQPSDLINELYLRLTGAGQIEWRDRGHFLAISARLMRRVLVDHARRRGVLKRGAGAIEVSLDSAGPAATMDLDVILSVHHALEALEALDARRASVVEMRYFGGLTTEETADALNVSEETVQRDWRLARAWLLMRLDGGVKT